MWMRVVAMQQLLLILEQTNIKWSAKHLSIIDLALHANKQQLLAPGASCRLAQFAFQDMLLAPFMVTLY